MRILSPAFLFAVAALAGCRGGAEYVPPFRALGDGVPPDLPDLAAGDFAVLRLAIHG
ncbi:MAG: hypothetical protein WAT39_17685 [Planctomycetota bacterium]